MLKETKFIGVRSIALYCRVSTDEQAREGVSLDEQQERLKAYCRAMGWNHEVELFIDDGYSAKNTERPQLKKLLKSVKMGQVSKVMVTKLDRMSRKLLDLLNLIDLFQEQEVSFISISESFDTNTPSGRLTLQVLGAVAEFERERIRERVFDNMLHAAGNGKWLTQSPYGYQLIDKNLVINDSEAKIVKRIFNSYLHEGKGYFAIAKQLNEENIPSRFNKEWSLRSVKLMLSNPVYKGTLVWNRINSSKKKRQEKEEEEWVIVDDCLPTIIDKETWEAVQSRLNKKQIPSRAQSSPHLLGGLLKCGNCGGGMSISWSGSKNNRYRVYRCSNNKNKGTCTSKQYKADEVESWFKQGLLQLTKNFSSDILLKLSKQTTHNRDLNIEQKIRSAKARYNRKVEAYTAGLIELNDLTEEKQRMDQIIEALKSEEKHQEIDLEKIQKSLEGKIKNVVDAISTLPIENAKALISTLVEKIIIKEHKEIEIILNLG
ncbi:recombinase family protein [Calidifontibacillus oryziterrae]|uniref:recombinase family protein n=1 Tax=Calidifontibacillus oryziterrae TaxID=1191699 RepID=UPI0002F84230|nr:recombinase family protein [Calidifontibacillus oryziterrae]